MMNTQRTLRRVGLVAGTSLLALAAIGPAASPALARPSGSIWTTSDDCSAASPQNDNSYLVGETLYVRGSNFAASSAFSWSIAGKPGGASGDPNQVVAAAGSSTDAAGAFCVAAYVIAADDWGEYSVTVDQGSTSKKDNYRVERSDEQDEDGGDDASNPPSDDPSDDPGDQETSPPADDTTPPADDTTPLADDTTPPTDDVTPPADDTTPPADDTTPPTDDATPPSDEDAPADQDATPPADDQIVDDIDNVPPPDVTDASDDEGSTDAPYQDVLGAMSGGPTITPPPTDMIVAPSDQSRGSEWRLILVFLGILVLAATIGLPERRRAA